MTALEINTVVEHYVCKIFQQAAKDLGVPVIVLPPPRPAASTARPCSSSRCSPAS
jgi:hypothetical protein